MKKILLGLLIVLVWVLIFLNEMSSPAFAQDSKYATCKIIAQEIRMDIQATYRSSEKSSKSMIENVYHLKRIERAKFWLELYKDLDCDPTILTKEIL